MSLPITNFHRLHYNVICRSENEIEQVLKICDDWGMVWWDTNNGSASCGFAEIIDCAMNPNGFVILNLHEGIVMYGCENNESIIDAQDFIANPMPLDFETPLNRKKGATIKIPREIYLTYIKSDKWKRKKAKVLDRDNHKCRVCGKGNCLLHVHHMTYDNFENEPLTDLVTLCPECHNIVHDLVDDAKLEQSRCGVEHRYEDWNFFPHMRNAPGDLVEIVVHTFRGNGFDKDVSDATTFLTDNDKLVYYHCCSPLELAVFIKYAIFNSSKPKVTSKYIEDGLIHYLANFPRDGLWVVKESGYGSTYVGVSSDKNAKYSTIGNIKSIYKLKI